MLGTDARVGFAGLGRMGWPMAVRLVAAGFRLAVHDAEPGRAQAFAEAHPKAAAAATPEGAARGADVVVIQLHGSRAVSSMLRAMRPQLAEGAVVVDMSAGDPDATRRMAEDLAARGVAMVDAPVSGGVARAESGTLAIMAGGEPAVLDRLDPLLRAMGGSLTRCGEVGAAQSVKALTSLANAAGLLLASEVLLIGRRTGLDTSVLLEVLEASGVVSTSTQGKLARNVLSGHHSSGLAIGQLVGEMSVALEMAHRTGTAAPFAAQCRELWAAAAGLLGSGQDHTAVMRFAEALSASDRAAAAD